MRINWSAVLVGFVVTAILALLVALMGPITTTSVFWLALPGIVGGFVAGYMVAGTYEGAVHGGLATVIGALVMLAIVLVAGVLFVGLLPALAGAFIGLAALFMQAIPGAIAGAVGGWASGRRTVRPETPGVTP